jgi:hypothetical protein
MEKLNLAWFGAAIAVLAGALLAGASVSTVLLVTILLACPVVVLLILRSAGEDDHDAHHQTRPAHEIDGQDRTA